MASESATTAEVPLRTATTIGRDDDGPPTECILSGSSGAPVQSEARAQEVLVPRKAVIIGVSRMIHDRNPTEYGTRYGPNDDAAHHVRMLASHLVVVGIALTVVACAAAAPGGDGKSVDRPSEQAT